jgi:beta-galactosidase
MPFWYAEGGWEEITPELLEKTGLPLDMEIDAAMAHPRMVEYQAGVLRKRIERMVAPSPAPEKKATREEAREVPGVAGAINGTELHPDAVPHFIEWLKEQYGRLEALKEAWNVHHVGISDRAAKWTTWQEVADGFNTEIPDREYRHLRDILRFRADMFNTRQIRAMVEARQSEDPGEPLRAGGEMGLFLPFASRGTDMEGIATEMAAGGSFYPSIHPAWHFEEVGFELTRTVYMQAQIASDWAKGIWTATWESTGGPQYFSGGKSWGLLGAGEATPGFTVDEGVITQMMLSWLAGGFRGFGLWCWNARTAGWEAGEFALLDRNNEVTARAMRAGQIGQAARRWRREIWAARKEPVVGVLVDWENEAMWAAMAVAGRDKFKYEPVRARVGISRALINANVPWEHVTPANLRAGLGRRYKVIYMPAFISIGRELQRMLLDYVNAGGRLVLDMPGAYLDEFGRMLPTGAGSLFEQTFGAVLHEFAYGSELNRPIVIGDVAIEGFAAVLTPTTARSVASYNDGSPAVTEARVGKGTAVIIGAQTSLTCWQPGREKIERLAVQHALGSMEKPYECAGAIVYRLSAPAADHFFLINAGASRNASLHTTRHVYKGAMDAITGERLDRGEPIALPPYSGRWLRFEK